MPVFGLSGSGTLEVTDGAAVSNSDGYLGYNSVSTGTVTVDGTGSTWTNSGDLYVGHYGIGTLDSTNGGLMAGKRCQFFRRFEVPKFDGFVAAAGG